MMPDPLIHSRPTPVFGRGSTPKPLETLTQKGLSFHVIVDPHKPFNAFNHISLYRNHDFSYKLYLKKNNCRPTTLKDKLNSGSLTPFSSTHYSSNEWVGCGSSIGFTVDKTSTHSKLLPWVERELKCRPTTHLIPTLKGGINGSRRVPSLQVEGNNGYY